MKCIKCPHFHIAYEPLKSGGVTWDAGMARCSKHDLVVDFFDHKKFNGLECVEVDEDNEWEGK